MKFFMAGLDTETNTFSPIPTGRQSFMQAMVAYGDATRKPLNCCSAQLAVWRALAEAKGWTVVESLCAVAEPGGITSRAVYEEFRDRIIEDLRTAGPVDFVLLALHGAMVAVGYDDVEGDLLSAVRRVVGPDVPVGAELDLHSHLTELMVYSATALVAYKEYPHIDIEVCAGQLFNIITDAAQGRAQPVMAVFDCRMLGTFPTQNQPLRGFVDRMKAMEGQGGVLAVSFIHGFTGGDVADIGAKMLVVCDGDMQKATELATQLGEEIYSYRTAMTANTLSIDQALDRAETAVPGPVVLADVADNPGGGAAGDSTFILRRIIERGTENVVSALHWDPVAVGFCREAGEGAVLDLRIGGKTGPGSGQPLDLKVTVRRIISGLTQRFGVIPMPIGDAVWLSAGSVQIVINTHRTQVFHPEFLTALGINLAEYRVIVVKSTNHFYAGFAPLAQEILFVDSPGTMRMGMAGRAYTKNTRLLWPLVDDPLVDGPPDYTATV